ncbi:MAG: heat-inducible transcriptional repressor HrcA [Actinomyces urogenitalis]|nr:heat-inducible transcriptional repressor HrcA [Actinomyces urogenitalis]KGF05056.1 HrcA family transcriptional regulator [Actinomyces urogenitalis S6-C4]MBS5976308.1 heat-inducible transcriptional repressor HrcA [Actinomyces urogenitalis]MBS6072858.1 heat-inducible transcriptional repressor HrcA [Actinomyces urogenitalis]MDK8237630.1 heat-inducible transcriptional repressor HrcA [Actinomyces urogenitalis]MDK8834845.1 heat-inducible transcriptional repressor HrcA [Actinomyces urogenitalis]
MADDRRLKVLSAIVTDYVRTREPVGSRAIVERYQLGVSPATIRNDMAALEDEGYIHQPHTSAGRVPTQKGYRLFVDEVARIKPLSAPERAAITALLTGEVDLDQVVARSVRVLAQLTGQLAVVEYPSLRRTALRHLELVVLAPTRVLLVIITDTGRVEQRTVSTPATEVLDPVAVEHLRVRLNAALAGLRAESVIPVLTALKEQASEDERALLTAVTSALIEALRPDAEERLAIAGTANLARSTPDFSCLGPLLDAIEEQVVLLRLFTDTSDVLPAGGAEGMRVSIGSENHDDALAEASVVTAAYGAGTGDAVAHLGVVGPTRMDYPATMTAVRAVARYLSRFLAGPDQAA